MIFIYLWKFKIIKKRPVFTSKFVKILKTFSKSELRDFELWLQSPWANAHKVLVPLLQAFKPYHPEFNKGKLTKEKLLKRVQPEGTYSLSRINNLLSKGFIAAEEFMIYQYLKKDENLRKDILNRELQNRHLEDWFFKNINSEIDRLESKEVKDWEDHLDLLRLHRRFYHHPNASTRMQPGGRTIIEMGNQLDLAYLLEKASIINEKIFRNRILKDEDHEVEMELNIWKVAAEESNHPAVALYRMRFEYDNENRLDNFFRLKNTFLSNYQLINKKEQKIHLLSLINDYSGLFKAGKLKYVDSLPLLKLGIETEVFFDNGKLSTSKYFTIISVSNTKGDFKFTEYFLSNYTEKLDQKDQEDALNWAKAHTLYRKGSLSQSIDYLISYKYKNTVFLFATKILTTQVYFDLYLKDKSYQEYLLSYFDSFEKWILREKTNNKKLNKGYLKFIQSARKLTMIYSEVEFDEEKFNQILLKETNIQAFDWLKRKKSQVLEMRKSGHSSKEK